MLSVDKDTKKLENKKEAVVPTPLTEKKVLITENVTTSEEVHEGNKKQDDTKQAVITIYRKYSDNFQGQSKGSTGWSNLDHEFLKIEFLHLNWTSIFFIMKGYLRSRYRTI